MASTQRSESMNAFFKGFFNSKTKLKQFVEQCEQALRKKVEKELIADAESCSKSIPVISGYPFENQLRDMYTLVKFQEFQKEIRGKIACEVVELDEEADVYKYVIREDVWVNDDYCKELKFNVALRKIETDDDSSEDEDDDITIQVVDDGEGTTDLETDNESGTDESETTGSEAEKSNTDDSENEDCVFDKTADETETVKLKKEKNVDFDVHCSCKLFESKGILCRHAIVVLIRNGIRLIPEKYILRRWRKDVTRPHTKVKVSFSCWELNESSLRYNQMSLKFNLLADLASVNDEQSKVVNEWLDNKIEELKAKSIELEKIKLNAEDQGDTSVPNVRNPAKKKRIGRKRSKRLKAKRARKRTKTKPSTKPSQDIITNIPDPILNDMPVTQESVATPTPSYPRDISHQKHTEGTRGRGTRGRGTRGRGTRGRGTRGRGAHGNAAQLSNSASNSAPVGMYMPVPAEAPYINPPYPNMRTTYGHYEITEPGSFLGQLMYYGGINNFGAAYGDHSVHDRAVTPIASQTPSSEGFIQRRS